MTITAVQPVRVYADTSVYGGVFDEEFARPSRRFFDRVREGRFILVLSPLIEQELQDAPPQVTDFFQQFRASAEPVLIRPEAIALSQAYLNAELEFPAYRPFPESPAV